MPSPPTELGFVDGLVQTSFLVQAILGRAAAAHDLTIAQLRLMGILRDREPGMLQLAGFLGLDKSSVTGLIDRAQRRGLVQRAADSADGRAVRVSVTPMGTRLTKQLDDEIVGEIKALGKALTAAERRVLAELLSRILSTP